MRWFAAVAVSLFVFACGASSTHSPRALPAPERARLDTVEGRRSAFLAAYRLLRAGDFAGAQPSFEALATRYPELEDYALHFLALIAAKTGDAARAVEIWGRLAESHPKSIFLGTAALERARIWRTEGRFDAARAVLPATRESGPEIRHEANFELAEIDAATGNVRRAVDQFLAVRHAAPGTTLGDRARGRMEQLRRADPSLQPSRSEREDELRLLLRERAHAQAVETANELITTAPDAARPELLSLRASAEQGLGDWNKAVSTLREVVERHPGSTQAPDCFYRFARLLWNHDRNTEAEQAFREFLRRYPKDRNNAEALYAVARIEQSSGRTEQAIATYGKLARKYPRGRLAYEARWRVGWIRYQQERWRAAADEFRRLTSAEGDRKSADALYWQARALENGGNATAAATLYRQILNDRSGSYYADLAEQRLGVRNAPVVPFDADRPLRIAEPPQSATERYHLVRARELQEIGLNALAVKELRAFEHENIRDPSLTRFLLAAYPAADGYREVVRLRRKKETSDPRALYPLAYWPLVTQNAATSGVDPLLVVSLMRQESMFDPDARSSANAIGLMQLLPSTANAVASGLKRSVTIEDLYDADVNITLGVAYLAQLHDRYGGEAIKVLAAYNAGEDAVAKWDQRNSRLAPDEWVESISYRETRDYVKRVLGNHRKYRELYGRAADHQ